MTQIVQGKQHTNDNVNSCVMVFSEKLHAFAHVKTLIDTLNYVINTHTLSEKIISKHHVYGYSI